MRLALQGYAASSGFLAGLISTTRLAGESVGGSRRSRQRTARSMCVRCEIFVVFGFEILLISITELRRVFGVRVLRRSGLPMERIVSSMRSRSERSAEIIVNTSTSYPSLPKPPAMQPWVCSVAMGDLPKPPVAPNKLGVRRNKERSASRPMSESSICNCPEV